MRVHVFPDVTGILPSRDEDLPRLGPVHHPSPLGEQAGPLQASQRLLQAWSSIPDRYEIGILCLSSDILDLIGRRLYPPKKIVLASGGALMSIVQGNRGKESFDDGCCQCRCSSL